MWVGWSSVQVKTTAVAWESRVADTWTCSGALCAVWMAQCWPLSEESLLSGAAGIMLAETVLSLLLPAMYIVIQTYDSEAIAAALAIAGLLVGAFLIWTVHATVPHEHFEMGREGPSATRLRQIWLFVIAITLHNFPEGMAVGVGFGGGDFANGRALAIGIGVQNIPEGLAVALSLKAINYSSIRAFFMAALTGLVEPIGGFLGAVAVTFTEPALPFILAVAGGAMLFVISNEIIPETHRRGSKTYATAALMIGFVVMMALDATLG